MSAASAPLRGGMAAAFVILAVTGIRLLWVGNPGRADRESVRELVEPRRLPTADPQSVGTLPVDTTLAARTPATIEATTAKELPLTELTEATTQATTKATTQATTKATTRPTASPKPSTLSLAPEITKTNDVNLVVASGKSPKPDRKEDMQLWETTIARQRLRLRLYALSLVQTLANESDALKDARVRLFVVGNEEGRAMITSAFDEARAKLGSGAWPLHDIIEISLTSDDILTKTLPLVDAGLTGSFKFRLWDFGKVWAMVKLPADVSTAIIVDTDVVFQSGLSKVFAWHNEQRRRDDKWLVAGSPEPENYSPKPGNPWEMRGDPAPRYVNTGVLLLNLDRVRKARLLEEMLPNSLKLFLATSYWKGGKQSQWPPEQFALNVVLGWYPWSFRRVPNDWVVDCTSDVGPWGDHRNPEMFQKAKADAIFIHYCNDQVGAMLTAEQCRIVTLASDVNRKCKADAVTLR